jgi:hypothetical protein
LIRQNFESAELYIPLISVPFAKSQELVAQFNEAVQRTRAGKKKIFPIIVGGNIDYERILPGLGEQTVFPYSENAMITLSSLLKTEDMDKDKVYADIVKLLNSEIK